MTVRAIGGPRRMAPWAMMLIALAFFIAVEMFFLGLIMVMNPYGFLHFLDVFSLLVDPTFPYPLATVESSARHLEVVDTIMVGTWFTIFGCTWIGVNIISYPFFRR